MSIAPLRGPLWGSQAVSSPTYPPEEFAKDFVHYFFQSLLVSDLKEAIARRALEEGLPWMPTILGIKNTRNKMLRIQSIASYVTNRWLWFSDRLPGEFYRQFRAFLPIDGHDKDDCCDATEGVLRVPKGLLDRRSPQ